MPGRRISRTVRKEIDCVLIAVRNEPGSDRVSIAQGCERRGAVWGDVELLQRESIIVKINEGKRVVTGRQTDLEGDFEIFAPVQVSHKNGEVSLFTSSEPTTSDNLGIPLF